MGPLVSLFINFVEFQFPAVSSDPVGFSEPVDEFSQVTFSDFVSLLRIVVFCAVQGECDKTPVFEIARETFFNDLLLALPRPDFGKEIRGYVWRNAGKVGLVCMS